MLGKEITIGGYLPGDSILHRLDTRSKFLCFFVLLLTVFLSSGASALVAPTVLSFSAMAVSGLGWRVWIKGLSKFRLMLLVTLFLNLFTDTDGMPIQLMGFVTPFSYEGLNKSLLLSARIALTVTLALTLTFTTLPWDLVRGLEFFMRPLNRFGISTKEISSVLFLAMRFVPLLQEEWRQLIEAQESRGIDFRSGGISARSRRLLSIFVPAIMMVFRKSEELSSAMMARGFRPGEERTEYVTLSFTLEDYCVLSMVTIMALAPLTG
ncbi:MAG: energy-coupling factor transporter transmembrane protein EcfT [Pseudomonadota bacterium]